MKLQPGDGLALATFNMGPAWFARRQLGFLREVYALIGWRAARYVPRFAYWIAWAYVAHARVAFWECVGRLGR